MIEILKKKQESNPNLTKSSSNSLKGDDFLATICRELMNAENLTNLSSDTLKADISAADREGLCVKILGKIKSKIISSKPHLNERIMPVVKAIEKRMFEQAVNRQE